MGAFPFPDNEGPGIPEEQAATPSPKSTSSRRIAPTKKPVRSMDEMDVDDRTLLERRPTPTVNKTAVHVEVPPRSIAIPTIPTAAGPGSSIKRNRESGEGTAPKRTKLAEGQTTEKKEEYVESDEDEERETDPHLMKESFDAKAAAFERRGEEVDLGDLQVELGGRVWLEMVPGLLGKVRLLSFEGRDNSD